MLRANSDVLEDEVLQVDVVLGLLHRLEHRGQRLAAVRQQARLIAEHQRAIGERVLQREMALQGICVEIRVDVRHGGARLKRRHRGQGKNVTSAGEQARHAWTIQALGNAAELCRFTELLRIRCRSPAAPR